MLPFLSFSFTMAAMLGGREFDRVTATTKKEGRKKAAQVALAVLNKEGSIKLADSSITPDVRTAQLF